MNGASLRISLAGAAATFLTSLALFPATENEDWLLPGALIVAFIALSGWGLRRLHTPASLIPLVQLVATAWLLLVMYADDLVFAVLPGPDAIANMGERLNSGAEWINRYAAPLETHPDVGVVITVGIALIGFSVDVLAATLRVIPWAGLPLLLFYSIPATTVEGGLSPLVFIPTAIGYVALLMSEGRHRLAGWGKVAGYTDSGRTRPEISTTILGQTGRRVGAAVIGVAVVVPWLLPELPESAFLPEQGPAIGSGGSGSSGRMISVKNPMLDLKRNLRMPENVRVMTVETTAEQPEYIRTAVLDEFTGHIWKPRTGRVPPNQQVRDRLPVPGLSSSVDRNRVTTQFQIARSLRSERLPVPLYTTHANVSGDWRYDAANQNVVSGDNGTNTAGMSYTTTSLDLDLDPNELADTPPAPATIASQYTALPEDVPEQVEDLAFSVANSGTSDYARAVALQEWFRNEFTYSTAVEDGHGDEALLEFIRDKRGYCEQFAATMAIMARALDIPARVAVGYMRGEPRGGNRWEISSQDAHAWPELYFEGYGWVRFEPTPAQQTGNAPDWTEDVPENTPLPEPSTSDAPSSSPEESTPQPSETTQASPTPSEDKTDKTAAGGGGGGDGFPIHPAFLGGGAGAIILLLTPSMLRRLIRSRRLMRSRPPGVLVEGAWRELADTVSDFGSSWDPAATPRSAATRLTEWLPRSTHQAIWSVSDAVERQRYAPTPGRVSNLHEQLRVIRHEAAASASRPRRLLGRCAPPSVFQHGVRVTVWPFRWAQEHLDQLSGWAANKFRRGPTTTVRG